MINATLSKLVTAGFVLATLSMAPAFAQSTNTESQTSPATSAPAANPATQSTPSTAPAANSPAQNGPAAVTQGNNPAAPSTNGSGENGQSTESTSEADKPGGPIADMDVFGFDITMGTANLTADQKQAAMNTCRDNVTIDPVRYSSAVKAFCDTMK